MDRGGEELLLMDRGGEELLELGSAIEKAVLGLSVQIECLVHCASTEPSKPIIHTGVKLPKTNVQTAEDQRSNIQKQHHGMAELLGTI